MSNRIVFTTYGSLGDLHPYVALAIELKERGHQVLIATSELYRSRIKAEGIDFYPVRPDVSFFKSGQQNKEIIRRSMDSKEGIKYLLSELILPHLKDSYKDLMQAVRGADLLVTHHLTFAGPLVAEKTGIRWISSVLAPILISSAYDSLVLSDQSNQIWSQVLNPLTNSIIINLSKYFSRPWSEPIRQLRAVLGLPPVENPLFESQNSPDLVLALFSQVFAEPQPDWPKQTYITGFPFYGCKSGETELPPELSQFLDDGPPPIVFTLGSAAVHVADDFYLESAAAAEKLGYRAVLLVGGDGDHQWSTLQSERVAVFDYAPYSQLFPHAAAIVHQGGIGTTAQALRAGRSMLIVPFSHDQPNNAARAERLGVARTIARDSYTDERAAAELRQLLENPSYSKRAAEVGRQIQAEDGVRAACDLIEARLNLPT